MKIDEIKAEANTDRKRKGRGISAGQGKTAGRGTKGQNSRSGGKRRPGFEGGQTPLFQRIPKMRGFKSKKTAATTVTLKKLELSKSATVSLESLIEDGIVDDSTRKVKIVATGELTKKLAVNNTVQVSAGAKVVIEKAGGSVTV